MCPHKMMKYFQCFRHRLVFYMGFVQLPKRRRKSTKDNERWLKTSKDGKKMGENGRKMAKVVTVNKNAHINALCSVHIATGPVSYTHLTLPTILRV